MGLPSFDLSWKIPQYGISEGLLWFPLLAFALVLRATYHAGHFFWRAYFVTLFAERCVACNFLYLWLSMPILQK